MSEMTWRQCLDAGMTAHEAAEAMGKSITSAYLWAKQNHTAFRRSPKGPRPLPKATVMGGRKSPSPMPFPNCGAHDLTTLDSRPTAQPGFPSVRRRKGCRACGNRFVTYEVPEHELEAMQRPETRAIKDALLRLVAAMPE